MTPDTSAQESSALTAPRAVRWTYSPGDIAWIHCGLQDGRGNPILSEARVLTWLDFPDFGQRFYVLQMQNPDWMCLEIRDALLMTDDPTKGLPFQKTRHFGLTEPPPKRHTTHA